MRVLEAMILHLVGFRSSRSDLRRARQEQRRRQRAQREIARRLASARR